MEKKKMDYIYQKTDRRIMTKVKNMEFSKSSETLGYAALLGITDVKSFSLNSFFMVCRPVKPVKEKRT